MQEVDGGMTLDEWFAGQAGLGVVWMGTLLLWVEKP